MPVRYTEVPTDRVRYEDDRGNKVLQRLHEKITPARTMIIDGRRCEVQRIVGGVWRDVPTAVHDGQENDK